MNDLPRLMVITARERMKPSFSAAVDAALAGGARMIQLRTRFTPDSELANLAQTLYQKCEPLGGQVIVNERWNIAHKVGVGLHRSEIGFWPWYSWMAPIWGDRSMRDGVNLCGASVHSVEAAQKAQELGADYVQYGHIFETLSHPGQPGRGLEALRKVCESVSVPVYAVGGITAQNARACREAGAYGVAVIGAVWDAPDVGEAVRQLLTEVE